MDLVPSAELRSHTITDDILKLPLGKTRMLIAIAGPPAAGKSTVAALVKGALESQGIPTGLLPMDGYHLDNEHLDAQGLLPYKGAPSTFDLHGFSKTVLALENEQTVKIALFDRALDKTIPDAATISSEQRYVVIEGNYLLLDAPGWRDLSQFWSYSAFIQDDIEVLSERLTRRWLDHGFSYHEAKKRAELNDIPNAFNVLHHRLPCTRQV